jgi:hypothetical protein
VEDGSDEEKSPDVQMPLAGKSELKGAPGDRWLVGQKNKRRRIVQFMQGSASTFTFFTTSPKRDSLFYILA